MAKVILNFMIDDKLLAQLNKFWHQNEFESRAAAIKWLLKWALEQKPKAHLKGETK